MDSAVDFLLSEVQHQCRVCNDKIFKACCHALCDDLRYDRILLPCIVDGIKRQFYRLAIIVHHFFQDLQFAHGTNLHIVKKYFPTV